MRQIASLFSYVALICISHVAYGSHYLVFDQDRVEKTIRLHSPYQSGRIEVWGYDEKQIRLDIDGSRVDLGPAKLSRFPRIDLASAQLARDGHDSTRLYLLIDCWARDDDAPSGRLVLRIGDGIARIHDQSNCEEDEG